MPKKLEGLREDIAAAAAKLPNTIGGGRELKKLVGHLWEGSASTCSSPASTAAVWAC